VDARPGHLPVFVEQGNPAKLLEKKGFYAEHYNSQLEGKKI
jgi:ABC-type multidrug transport system fused ATPase/permease subunit